MRWKSNLQITLVILFLATAVSANSQGPKLERLTAHFQIPGYFRARSALRDTKALGGFASSENVPIYLENGSPYANKGIQLIAITTRPVAFQGKYQGFEVLLVNGPSAELPLPACDSVLPIIREATDKDGNWKPIEFLASSWCGNSYHNVFLLPGQYWKFTAPTFEGSRDAKMRFKLRLPSSEWIYSNEFSGRINSEQFLQRGPVWPTQENAKD